MEKKKQVKVKEKATFKVHEVNNTPFTVVEMESKFQIAIGNQLVSIAKFDTLKEAKNYITRKPWELLGNVICSLSQKVSEQVFIKLTKETKK